MKPPAFVIAFLGSLACSTLYSQTLSRPISGPQTEKRFPKLIVPAGFSSTLFACDPLVEYPSVLCLGPRYGSLFVAHDYVTGLGVKIVRRDEVRFLQDTDGDGYADKLTVFAGGFNSIQGLAFDGTAVYVMHAPLLTRVEDTNGDGVADRRKNLLSGLGLPPEKNSNRLHCANGVVVGHDGWLYLALGDRGCNVIRPEGDRLLFREGGILRVRRDGSQLHVFCSGLRNIYDVALDDQLNVFVRDNENDGGDYMIRVCHCFFGSDHGYPYLYRERPREAMPPLADLGRGSSAGGTAYLEGSFPPEYRGALLFCEWGRAVVSYPLSRRGSSFAEPREADFATTAATDPYGFKPTDVVVDWDGSLLISDWCDGQRPKRGRGRIYRVTAKPTGQSPAKTEFEDLFQQLDSPGYLARCVAQRRLYRTFNRVARRVRDILANGQQGWRARSHLIWMLAQARRGDDLDLLAKVVRNDADPRVRVQAIRAVADWCDPRFDKATAEQRTAIIDVLTATETHDPRVKLAVFTALGRFRRQVTANWLARQAKNLDRAQVHALQQLLGNGANWPAVLRALDEPALPVGAGFDTHELAVSAAAGKRNAKLIDGLLQRVTDSSSASVRRLVLDVLALVHRKPKPAAYWGFRPQPRTPGTLQWARTNAIERSLRSGLADVDFSVREMAARRMLRENVPIPSPPLIEWLKKERHPPHVATALRALQSLGGTAFLPRLAEVILDKSHHDTSRSAALTLYQSNLKQDKAARVLDLAGKLEDGPLLARLLTDLPKTKSAHELLNGKIESSRAVVRAAALDSLRQRKQTVSTQRLLTLLEDEDPRVARSAAATAGQQKISAAAARLLKLAAASDAELRSTSLISLRQIAAAGAVPQALEALKHPESQSAALQYLGQFGNAGQRQAVSRTAADNLSADVQRAAVRALHQWQQSLASSSKQWLDLDRRIARIQANSGTPIRWRIYGPSEANRVQQLRKQIQEDVAHDPTESLTNAFSRGLSGEVPLDFTKAKGRILAASRLLAGQATEVEILASSSGEMTLWLNNRVVLNRPVSAKFAADSDRRTARLKQGRNQLVVMLPASAKRFQLRLRQKSSQKEHELLTASILSSAGNPQRGREVFHTADRAQCVRCHRIDSKGGNIGPDLSGVGRRFSKIHLLESILEPSRSIAPSYRGITLRLANGRVLSGVKVSESDGKLTLGDTDGKTHVIATSEIDESKQSPISVMPVGLEKRLTRQQLADLIAFLISQKGKR